MITRARWMSKKSDTVFAPSYVRRDGNALLLQREALREKGAGATALQPYYSLGVRSQASRQTVTRSGHQVV